MGFLERLFGPRRERLKALAARVEALEAAFPRYDMHMDGLVEECRDLLDRSERKRGRAAADLSAASRSRGDFDDAAGSDPRNTPAVQAAAARLRAIHS